MSGIEITVRTEGVDEKEGCVVRHALEGTQRNSEFKSGELLFP